jgi:hypothetical protein
MAWQGEALRGATLEANVEDDLALFDERHIFDE